MPAEIHHVMDSGGKMGKMRTPMDWMAVKEFVRHEPGPLSVINAIVDVLIRFVLIRFANSVLRFPQHRVAPDESPCAHVGR